MAPGMIPVEESSAGSRTSIRIGVWIWGLWDGDVGEVLGREDVICLFFPRVSI